MPLDLPGAPLGTPNSKKTIRCPRCNHIIRGGQIEAALKGLFTKEITIRCKNCNYPIKLNKPK